MKFYFIRLNTKELCSTVAETMPAFLEGCHALGQYETKSDCMEFIYNSTEALCNTIDEIIELGNYSRPKNMPSWNQYINKPNKTEEELLWLYCTQLETSKELTEGMSEKEVAFLIDNINNR